MGYSELFKLMEDACGPTRREDGGGRSSADGEGRGVREREDWKGMENKEDTRRRK